MNKRKPIRYDPYNDFYFVLGVMPTATAEELQHAYRLRAKQVHPDLNRDRVDWANEQFQRLNEAYDVLGDPSLRIEYDRVRQYSGRRSAPAAANWWDRPHTPGQPPPPYSTPPQARPGGTYRAKPTNPGAARATGTSTGTYKKSTGTYRAAPGFTPPPPSYTTGSRPYRSDFQAVAHGFFRGSNRYIISAAFALMFSYLLCFGVLSAMNVFPSDSQSANDDTSGTTRNQILVILDATDFAPQAIPPKCTDNVNITELAQNQDVVGYVKISGTATDPKFYSYDVAADWLGEDPHNTEVKRHYILSTPNYTSVTKGVLVPVADFTSYPTGYYVLRLTVTLLGGDKKLPPCEVHLYRRQL